MLLTVIDADAYKKSSIVPYNIFGDKVWQCHAPYTGTVSRNGVAVLLSSWQAEEV